MKSLVKIYRQNIYGVMGTLIFHILLFVFFLLAEIDLKGNIKEESVIIEFPVLEEEKEEEEITNSSGISSPDHTTNLASNRSELKARSTTLPTEKFFDNEYQNELKEAQNMVSDVSKQLAKEKMKIEDIKMPVQTIEEGKDPDSVKNVVYSGESNIVYYLDNRYHTSLPIPVYLTQGGGKIIVDIIVDRNGTVVKATPRNDVKIKDEQVYLYARVAAERTRFNADTSAPVQQKGSIHYNFKSQ